MGNGKRIVHEVAGSFFGRFLGDPGHNLRTVDLLGYLGRVRACKITAPTAKPAIDFATVIPTVHQIYLSIYRQQLTCPLVHVLKQIENTKSPPPIRKRHIV
ncbi:unnamed protein product [Strongylus vulgaris]|uniref:Uncharacterized protein n=1 Tax=Strongylus vulgaris TaxID=40348 RepID=A0A3P7LUM8_STRVU|nr:unnamed protein product [Strongylus vulgaris]